MSIAFKHTNNQNQFEDLRKYIIYQYMLHIPLKTQLNNSSSILHLRILLIDRAAGDT